MVFDQYEYGLLWEAVHSLATSTLPLPLRLRWVGQNTLALIEPDKLPESVRIRFLKLKDEFGTPPAEGMDTLDRFDESQAKEHITEIVGILAEFGRVGSHGV